MLKKLTEAPNSLKGAKHNIIVGYISVASYTVTIRWCMAALPYAPYNLFIF